MTDVEKNISAILGELIGQERVSQSATDNEATNIRLSNLGLDSLEKMDLAMQLEDSFGVLLDEEEFLACDTIPDLAKLIEKSASDR